MEIDLPFIKLRPYQQVLWDQWFTKRTKKMSLEWHRRAGKDLFCLNIMIAEAMVEVGNYWFILPESQQVRNAIWEGITSEGTKYLDFVPPELIFKTDNQSMKLYFINPHDPTKAGSIISFVGGDRYDKRVGAGLKGCVISEHSLQKPNLYDLAVEPMLKETNGWVIFNFTPRGENHATKMWDFLDSREEYIASSLNIEGTGVVDPASLEEERLRGKPEELIQQEYYCSREGAVFGSYFGDVLKQNRDKIGAYPYDPAYPVHTMWDLGISDSMAIWFVQFIGHNIHVIDHYENNNYGLGHYAGVLRAKGYMYSMHHLPHDGRKRHFTEEERAISVEEQLKRLEVSPIRIHEARNDIYGSIQRTRAILPRCFFDKEKTKDGLEALKQYQREWDESRQVFKNTPLHNWASHSADAFTILPTVEVLSVRKINPNRARSKAWNGKFH